MKKRALILASVLIALIAVMLVVARARSEAPLVVMVSFLDYTNSATGARLAMFSVTNASAIRSNGGAFMFSRAGTRAHGRRFPGCFISDRMYIWRRDNRKSFPSRRRPITASGALPSVVHAMECGADSTTGWDRVRGIPAVVPERWRTVPAQRVMSDWIEK